MHIWTAWESINVILGMFLAWRKKNNIKDITDLKLPPRVQSVVTGNGKISLKGTVKKELVQHDSGFHT